MKHVDKLCVTDHLLPPALPSFPGRVGPNSRWCRGEAWTWDIQISGSLTSTPGKQEGAINARFICKCIFFLSPNSLYWLEIYVFHVFCLKKTENNTSRVGVTLCTQLISLWMGLSLVWMQLRKLCIMVFNLSNHSESCNILHFLDVRWFLLKFSTLINWLLKKYRNKVNCWSMLPSDFRVCTAFKCLIEKSN